METDEKPESDSMNDREDGSEFAMDTRGKAEYYKEKGNEEFKAKNYYQALDLYKLAIETDATNPAFYNNLAAAQLMVKQYKNAIESCKSCVELDPANTKAWVRLGRAYVTLGLSTEALAALNKALELEPTNGAARSDKKEAELLAARLTKVRELTSKGEFNQALPYVQASLRQAPESRELLLLNVESLIRSGDYDNAYAATTHMMRDDQNDAKLLYYRALCLYYQENFSLAIRHLQQALQLDPDYKLAQVEIKKIRKLERTKEEGNTQFKTHQYHDAIVSYSDALAVDPDHKAFNAKLYCNRAAAYQKLKKFSEAVADCDQAFACDPQYAKALTRKAACLRELGGKENLERAMGCYDSAQQLLGRTEEIHRAMQETKLELKKAKRKDYYQILELPNRESSNDQEIKKAYRKAALKWHPDRHTNDTEEEKVKAEAMFKDVGEAYEVLSDSTKRQKYDSGLTLEEIEQGGPMGGHHDPNEIFQMFFGGGRGGGGSPFGGGGGNPFAGGGGGHTAFHFG